MATWYRTGTVTVTNGSASVAGILTGWTDGLVKDGDALFIPASSDYPGEILTVNSATSITLAANWHGTSQTSVAYFIFKGMEWGDVTRLATEISELLESRVEILGGVGAPSDSLGADGSVYFRSDVPEYYTKDAGTWSSAISLTGPTGPAGALATATSTTSLTIGTGSRTLATQASRSYVVGSRIRVASSASPTNYMEGLVTSYSSTTLIFTSDRVGGSGTIASWNIAITGDVGSTGATGASYSATSTTSLAIGTGTKAFTTQAGLAYVAGQRVRAANTADTANFMEGRITAYSSTTLTVSVDLTGGSGTLASWNIGIAGQQGIQGIQGIQGAQGIQGVAGPGYAATSTTSNTIGTGNKTFTTQAGLSYVVGASRVRVSDSGGTNYMEGLVTAYSGTSLTVAVDDTSGSGTLAAWNISLAGQPGIDGTNGTDGTDGTIYNSTSSTTLTAATGSKVFTVAAGLGYTDGQRIRAVSEADNLNWMSGLVDSYSGTTLTTTMDLIGPGAASASDWVIALTGEKGDPGPSGGFSSLLATKGNWPLGDGTTYGAMTVGANGTLPLADSTATYGVAWTAAAAVNAAGYWSSTDVASAATCDIGAAVTPAVNITGTTTITSFGTGASKVRFVRFAASLTLTYNGTTLVLPGAANIVTQAGDCGIFVSDASGNWRCYSWTPVGYIPRERLTANRTYYVRTDGVDTNNGLANTAGGAFLTIQRALNVVIGNLDFGGYTVTIQIADGTYAGGMTISAPWTGGGSLVINGNTTTPANVIISASACLNMTANLPGVLTVRGFKHTGAGTTLLNNGGGNIEFNAIDFAGTGFAHVQTALPTSIISVAGSYAITACGATTNHYYGSAGLIQRKSGVIPTVTITGTMAFSTFANMSQNSILQMASVTYNIAAATVTGRRYNAATGSVIQTSGGGASYFPGDVAGVGTNFGVTPWGYYA